MALKYKALLLANWTYEHLPVLNGPKNDIELMRTALSNPEFGLFTEAGSIEVHAELASSTLSQTIERFLGKAGVDDYLLIYYSGHGARTSGDFLGLCGTDADDDTIDSTTVDTGKLRSWIERRSGNRPTLIVLDCCFAGQVGITKGASATSDATVLARNLPEGVLVLASSGRKASLDAAAPEETSPYTKLLTEILLDPTVEGDRGDGALLTGFRAHQLLEERLQGPVRPWLKGDVGGDFGIAKRPPPPQRKQPTIVELPGWPREELEPQIVDITFTDSEIRGPWSNSTSDAPTSLAAFDPRLSWAIRRLINLTDEAMRQQAADKESVDAVRSSWQCIGDALFGTVVPEPLKQILRQPEPPPGGLLKLRLAFSDRALEDYPWEYLLDLSPKTNGTDVDAQRLPLGRRPRLLLERAGAAPKASPGQKLYKAMVVNTYTEDLARTGDRVRDDLVPLFEQTAVSYLSASEATWPTFRNRLLSGASYLVLIAPLKRVREQPTDPKIVKVGFTRGVGPPEWHTEQEVVRELSEKVGAFEGIVLMTYAASPGHDSLRAVLGLASRVARAGLGPVAYGCAERAYQTYLENQMVAETFPSLFIRALVQKKPVDRAFVWARNGVLEQSDEETTQSFGIPGLYAPQETAPPRTATTGIAASAATSQTGRSPSKNYK